MLETQTELQFEDAHTELRAFIDEKKRQPLSNWLAWWVTRKEHIFRAFLNAKIYLSLILPRITQKNPALFV